MNETALQAPCEALHSSELNHDVQRKLTVVFGATTLIRDQQVEPTNNVAERVIRQAVIWRKMSFGAQSKRGSCYVERMLAICSTCRLQGRSIIAYMRMACDCHMRNQQVANLRPQ